MFVGRAVGWMAELIWMPGAPGKRTLIVRVALLCRCSSPRPRAPHAKRSHRRSPHQ